MTEGSLPARIANTIRDLTLGLSEPSDDVGETWAGPEHDRLRAYDRPTYEPTGSWSRVPVEWRTFDASVPTGEDLEDSLTFEAMREVVSQHAQSDSDSSRMYPTGGSIGISSGHAQRRYGVAKCSVCTVRRPVRSLAERRFQTECFGECESKTSHEPMPQKWEPQRYEFRCPECGYETVMWECEGLESTIFELPDCPQCDKYPEAEGSDAVPVWPTPEVDPADIDGGIDAEECIDDLTDFKEIDIYDAMKLMSMGYPTPQDVAKAVDEGVVEVEERVDGGDFGFPFIEDLHGKDLSDVGRERKLVLASVVLEGDADKGDASEP